MKKFFSILFVCCVAFVFADDQPVFKEADDTECRILSSISDEDKDEAFETFLERPIFADPEKGSEEDSDK